MQFTVNTLTRCTGGDHYHLNITVGAETFTVSFLRQELSLDKDDRKDAILNRVRSFAKEGGYSTFAALRTAIQGQSFQV